MLVLLHEKIVKTTWFVRLSEINEIHCEINEIHFDINEIHYEINEIHCKINEIHCEINEKSVISQLYQIHFRLTFNPS